MVRDRHLQHMRQPDTPAERERSPSTHLDDFEALYLRRALLEYCRYGKDDLACSYAEYLQEQIRENKQEHCQLYAHTERAVMVLLDALGQTTIAPTEMEEQLKDKIFDLGIAVSPAEEE